MRAEQSRQWIHVSGMLLLCCFCVNKSVRLLAAAEGFHLCCSRGPCVLLPHFRCNVLQVFHPGQFQKHILEQRGEDTVVRGSPMPGFFLNSLFMPATMELTKAVFAEEPTGAVTQGMKSIPLHGFGELQPLVNLPVRDSTSRCTNPIFGDEQVVAILSGQQRGWYHHSNFCTLQCSSHRPVLVIKGTLRP